MSNKDIIVGPKRSRMQEWFRRHPVVGLIIFMIISVVVTIYGLFVWIGAIEPTKYIIFSYLAFPIGVFLIAVFRQRFHVFIKDRKKFMEEQEAASELAQS